MNIDININCDYNDIKSYYDTFLNVNKDLVKTSNDEPTPIGCVEEMVNKVEDSFWEKEQKILDPCCGCGNFFFVIYFKLIKYHSQQKILEEIFTFNDINEDRLKIVKQIFLGDKYKLNITSIDFTKYPIDKIFNLVVANPPYAKLLSNGKRASKNHNLIGVFINKTFEILADNGLLLYITPDNWMSYADRNILIKKLTELQIHYLNIHIAKKYFKKIGSSFVWYLIENTPSYKDIEIEGIWKGKIYKDNVKSEIRKFIPLLYNKQVQNILNKTIDNDNKKFEIKTSSDLHKYTKKKLISKEKTDTFKYKLIHTPKQIVWSSRPHKFQDSHKVFISTTTYYSSFVDKCGMTQSIAFIDCENEKEANKINEVLKHPLYKFLNNICRYGNFNNIRVMQNFPYCETYDDVYKSFNITDDEIEYIENNI